MICKLVLVLAVATAAFGTPVKKYLPRNFLEDGKIVGGTEAAEGEIPFMVSIETNDGRQFCGGTILSEEFIMTAAHCSNNYSYRVRAGSLIRQTGGSLHTIVDIITHRNYTSSDKFSDISLWHIEPPFIFDANTAAVTLPAQETDTPAGTMVTVSGWGTTTSGGSSSEFLLKVDMPIVDKALCDEQIAINMPPNQICAGLPEGGVDFCQGDSGGPLFKDGVVLGIVSYGYGCAFPNSPGVYTEVSAYRDWITEQSGV